MATVTSTNLRVNVKLDNGTTESGATKTVSIPLGTLDRYAFNAEKVIAIVGLLSSVLSKGITMVEKVETSVISAD